MEQIKVQAAFARVLVTTFLRRLVRGRGRPSWSLWYETFARFMQLEADVMATLDAPAARSRLLARSQPTPLRKKLDCEAVRFHASDGSGIDGEWFRPAGAPSDRVLLYLHGGGYVFGSIRSHEDFIARLALGAALPALAIDYRLAPEHPFPAGRDDVIAVIDALVANGVPIENVILAGDSAGGGLALQVLFRLREQGQKLPGAAVLLSPWSDLTCSFESFRTNDRYDYIHKDGILVARDAYCGAFDREDVSVSFASLADFPSLFILAGDAEMLRDNAVRLAERAKEDGVDVTLEVWPDMIHAWPQFAFVLKEGQLATQRISEWLRTHANNAGSLPR